MTRWLARILALGLLAAGLFGAIWAVTLGSRLRMAEIEAALPVVMAEEERLFDRLAQPAEQPSASLSEDLFWPETGLADVEIAMQNALLGAATASGMDVVAFGTMGPDDRCVMACATYEAELSGGHEQAVTFLAALERLRPGVSVGSLWMRQLPPDGLTADARVSLRISVWGFAPAIRTGGAP